MAQVKTQTKHASKASGKKTATERTESRQKRTLAERIGTLLQSVEAHFEGESVKASVTDYIRLLQMHRECEDHGPQIIEVSWIDTKLSGE